MTRSTYTTPLRICAVTALLSLTVSACGSSGSSASGSKSADTPTAVQGASSSAAQVPTSSKGPITVAVYNDGAPEDFLRAGKPVGIQVDIAQAAARILNRKIAFVAVGGFDTLIPGLQAGRYDASFADFGITPERLKVVDFINEFSLGTSFAVKKGSGKVIKTASDLCGLKVGTLAGSYFLDQVAALSKQCTSGGKKAINISAFPTQAAAVLAVGNGRADAYGTSTDQVQYTASQSGANLDAQPFVYGVLPQGIALPKNSPLAKPLVAALQHMVADGTYRKILQKWNLAQITPKASEIKLVTTAP